MSGSNPSRKQSEVEEVEEEKLIEIKDSVYQTLEESVRPEAKRIDEVKE